MRIRTGFGPTPQVTTREALRLWFPRALAHEVNHAVRLLNGPGFGPTLLPQLISEGMATAFDQAAFPGPVNPSYRRHHPGVSWETLASTSATTILAGSHYQPCPQ